MAFIGRINAAQQANNSLLCVGWDPELEKFPAHLHNQPDALFDFFKAIVDATADLLGVLALEQLRNAAGELQVFDTACQFAGCIAGHLAMLNGDEVGDLGPVLVDELTELEHDLCPLGQGG